MAHLEELTDGVTINPLESDPFQYNGGGGQLELDDPGKEFNGSQLADEISKRTGIGKVSLAIVKHDGRKVMWYQPSTMDKRTLRGAVKSHRPDENWGLTEDEQETRGLLHRLKSGETLSVEQTTKVLRAMIEDQSKTGTYQED